MARVPGSCTRSCGNTSRSPPGSGRSIQQAEAIHSRRDYRTALLRARRRCGARALYPARNSVPPGGAFARPCVRAGGVSFPRSWGTAGALSIRGAGRSWRWSLSVLSGVLPSVEGGRPAGQSCDGNRILPTHGGLDNHVLRRLANGIPRVKLPARTVRFRCVTRTCPARRRRASGTAARLPEPAILCYSLRRDRMPPTWRRRRAETGLLEGEGTTDARLPQALTSDRGRGGRRICPRVSLHQPGAAAPRAHRLGRHPRRLRGIGPAISRDLGPRRDHARGGPHSGSMETWRSSRHREAAWTWPSSRGHGIARHAGLLSLGSVFFEPLWVFVRAPCRHGMSVTWRDDDWRWASREVVRGFWRVSCCRRAGLPRDPTSRHGGMSPSRGYSAEGGRRLLRDGPPPAATGPAAPR